MPPFDPDEYKQGETLKEEDPLFRMLLLENFISRLRAVPDFAVFQGDQGFNLLFAELVVASREGDVMPPFEEIRALHGKILARLKELVNPEAGKLLSFGMARKDGPGKAKLKIPDGFEDFDRLVAELVGRLDEEDKKNAYASAADSLILGEITLDEVILTAKKAVQEKALLVLKAYVLKPLTAYDDFAPAETAVSAILELLKLTDDALIREQRGLHSEVARIITSARREIRISHNARATTRRVRFKQMKRLLHNGEEPDPPEEEATSLSHPDTRPFATDSSLDINIHRMRTGTGVPPNQPLEFHRQSGELARIEAQALEALTGRKPGGKKEKPPTNMRHMAVVPPPTDD